MQQPPLLPEETLARVERLARFDGLGVLILSSFFAVMSALAHDIPFVIVGLLGAGAGAVELHGVALLKRYEPRGMNWIVGSQPFLLVVILGYCVLRLAHYEVPAVPDRLREMVTLGAQQWNLSVDEYFRMVNRLTAQIVAGVACLYQGGMTFYYWRRKAAVQQALAEP